MNLLDFRFITASAVQPDPTWHLPPHSHSFHEIIVVLRGRLILTSGGQRIVARKSDVLFYRAGFVHEEASDPRAPVGTLFIAFGSTEPMPWLPLLLQDTSGRIRQIARWLVDDEHARRGPQMRQPLFEALLGELRRLGDTPPDPWLERVVGFMRENLARPLRLDDLARCARMSRFAFVRKFKRLSGRTPMEELRRLRLHRARTLLLTTSLPVKAVAPAVGIGDEYQFSKLFRSHFDLPPRELRSRGTAFPPRRAGNKLFGLPAPSPGAA